MLCSFVRVPSVCTRGVTAADRSQPPRRSTTSRRGAGAAPLSAHAGMSRATAANKIVNTSELESLRGYSKLALDSGSPNLFRTRKTAVLWRPVDATTNPSLCSKAAKDDAQFYWLAVEAIRRAKNGDDGSSGDRPRPPRATAEMLSALLARDILGSIPGRVSLEVDGRLNDDAGATVEAALRMVAVAESIGIQRQRLLVKVPATYAGIQAVAELAEHGVSVNSTLVFNTAQAQACALAGAKTVSPFVGRVKDWHRSATADRRRDEEDRGKRGGAASSVIIVGGERHAGLELVANIYNLFHYQGLRTEVMGASLRSVEEARALAGCDLLTLPGSLFDLLSASSHPLSRMLSPESAEAAYAAAPSRTAGREALFADANDFKTRLQGMAWDKLTEGCSSFAADSAALEAWIAELEEACDESATRRAAAAARRGRRDGGGGGPAAGGRGNISAGEDEDRAMEDLSFIQDAFTT